MENNLITSQEGLRDMHNDCQNHNRKIIFQILLQHTEYLKDHKMVKMMKIATGISLKPKSTAKATNKTRIHQFIRNF